MDDSIDERTSATPTSIEATLRLAAQRHDVVHISAFRAGYYDAKMSEFHPTCDARFWFQDYCKGYIAVERSIPLTEKTGCDISTIAFGEGCYDHYRGVPQASKDPSYRFGWKWIAGKGYAGKGTNHNRNNDGSPTVKKKTKRKRGTQPGTPHRPVD